MGLSHGKRGGDWYGPASTALILRDALVNRQLQPSPDNAELDNLSIFVAADGVVYLDELQTCVQQPSANNTGENENAKFGKSLLLIIPLRLGADKCNPVYIYHLKTVLSLKSCVGILGGRPKHSMYFIGWQRDSLIYLDPHYCQDAIEIEDTTEFPLQVRIFAYFPPWAHAEIGLRLNPSAKFKTDFFFADLPLQMAKENSFFGYRSQLRSWILPPSRYQLFRFHDRGGRHRGVQRRRQCTREISIVQCYEKEATDERFETR